MKTPSRKQEDRTAKTYGGRRTPGSGNQIWQKNDVVTDTESIECKITDKSQYILKHKDLETAEKNAILAGREMRFKLTMCGRNWILLSEEDYLVMRYQTRNGT